MKRFLIIYSGVFLVIIGSTAVVWAFNRQEEKPQVMGNETDSVNLSIDQQEQSSFDKTLYSLTDPSSLWFIANKQYALPLNYVPDDLIVPNVPLRLSGGEQQMQLRDVTRQDLQELFQAAQDAGLQLRLGSGYRSAALQKQFYNQYVATDGQAAADRYSARPGHSEHQTGLALDFTHGQGVCHLEECFSDLAEGKWLADNAHKYGFILRYPKGEEAITGYMYEPWHYRYVGKELATELFTSKTKTLEEFFELEPAPSYL